MRRDLLTWLILGDVAAVVLSALTTMHRGAIAMVPSVLAGALLLGLAWSFGALRTDVVDQAHSGWRPVVGAALATAPVALLLAQYLMPLLSTVDVLAPVALQAIVSLTNRAVEASWLRRRRLEGHGLRRTVVVMGVGAEPILRQLRRNPHDGFLVVGYLSAAESRTPNATPMGDVAALARTVHKERIDTVMTLGGVTPDALVDIMRALESTGARLVVVPGLQDVVPSRVRGLPVTHGWTGMLDVSLRRTTMRGKDLFDRVCGAIIFLFAAPVLLGVALAVRLDSPGPAFYTQERVGRGGETFTMWKLRSMYADADARRAEVVQDGGDAGNEILFKDRHDPRITRVGRVIRRASLDELPQLFNVLLGEMSLVGPRPALPHEVAQYDDEARRRLLVKPGMTGLWQVSGRSDLSWDSTVALDRHYVENCGPQMDVYVLASTLRAVAGGKGAY